MSSPADSNPFLGTYHGQGRQAQGTYSQLTPPASPPIAIPGSSGRQRNSSRAAWAPQAFPHRHIPPGSPVGRVHATVHKGSHSHPFLPSIGGAASSNQWTSEDWGTPPQARQLSSHSSEAPFFPSSFFGTDSGGSYPASSSTASSTKSETLTHQRKPSYGDPDGVAQIVRRASMPEGVMRGGAKRKQSRDLLGSDRTVADKHMQALEKHFTSSTSAIVFSWRQLLALTSSLSMHENIDSHLGHWHNFIRALSNLLFRTDKTPDQAKELLGMLEKAVDANLTIFGTGFVSRELQRNRAIERTIRHLHSIQPKFIGDPAADQENTRVLTDLQHILRSPDEIQHSLQQQTQRLQSMFSDAKLVRVSKSLKQEKLGEWCAELDTHLSETVKSIPESISEFCLMRQQLNGALIQVLNGLKHLIAESLTSKKSSKGSKLARYLDQYLERVVEPVIRDLQRAVVHSFSQDYH